MKVFENTTNEQEFLTYIGFIFVMISFYILNFTDTEQNFIRSILGIFPNEFYASVVGFIFRSILGFVVVIPFFGILCYCRNDNFIKRLCERR